MTAAEQKKNASGIVTMLTGGAARPGNNLIHAEGDSRGTQPCNLRCEIGYLQVQAVPPARHLAATIGQRVLPRAAVSAEQEAYTVPYDGREGRRGVVFQRP